MLDDPRAVFPADVESFVSAETVHDEYFIDPLDALDTAADYFFVVEGGDDGCNIFSHKLPSLHWPIGIICPFIITLTN